MSTVVIVHGWGGDSEGGWEPWLADELKQKGVSVLTPDMPNTSSPKIEEWVSFLDGLAKDVNRDLFFVGHSMGCQAILRYLETLPEGSKIGGTVFVAPWLNLTDENWDETYTREIAEPWIKTPINWQKISARTESFVVIYSDNDPYVPADSAQLIGEKLNAKIVLDSGRGHFSEEDDVTQLPAARDELLIIMGLPVETPLI